MKAVKFYITKQSNDYYYNYITDPINPTSPQEMGLVKIEDRSEMRVDDFGVYVTRFIP